MDQCCLVCMCGKRETILHRFWECASAQRAWKWGTHILRTLIKEQPTISLQSSNPRRREYTTQENDGLDRGITRLKFSPSWKHGIFAHSTPRRIKRVSRLWLLLRGTITWLLWMERNDVVFNGTIWSQEKMYHMIWLT